MKKSKRQPIKHIDIMIILIVSLCVAALTSLLLSFIFYSTEEFTARTVYYFGFPSTFLSWTVYTGPLSGTNRLFPPQFHYDLSRLIINIINLWIPLLGVSLLVNWMRKKVIKIKSE
ncbi:MAG: hypothetical protein FWE33_07275 [Defluviitaleaceae bacterium]|nr:hypothetical protein [Defluviitaleaceae bacterium]